MIIQCVDCIYWLEEEKSPHFGQCRLKAPLPEVSGKVGAFVGPYNWRTIWPYTRDADGCGEGKPGTRMRPKEQMKDQVVPFDDLVKNAREK